MFFAILVPLSKVPMQKSVPRCTFFYLSGTLAESNAKFNVPHTVFSQYEGLLCHNS